MLPLKSRLGSMSLQVRSEEALTLAVLTSVVGHGCGKLLQETSPGVYNFNHENPPVSPITGQPVKTWYKPGQTWGSVFGGLAGAYEVGILITTANVEADGIRNAALNSSLCI